MDALGHPDRSLRVLHVAGTNGKGSVCRYLYETLRACGYSAGIFTSPYVGDFRERIEANGEMIPQETLEALTDRVIAAAARIEREHGETPTEFEIVTSIGLTYFAALDPDFVILEVGLGGRGDSTNIVENPLVSVITSIALDHTAVLGSTTGEIAAEKAGIIKRGCPVVSAATGEAARVIARKAYETGAPLTDAHIEWTGDGETTPDGSPLPRCVHRQGLRLYVKELSLAGASFSAEILGIRYDDIHISMPGRHQIENAVCALAALEVLRSKKLIRLTPDALRIGMKTACLDGRFQIVSAAPLIILDGAHNPAGAKSLADTVRALLPGKRILVVCAVMRDKDFSGVIENFASFASAFIATESTNVRSMRAEDLAAAMEKIAANQLSAQPVHVTAAADVTAAYDAALAAAGDYDAVIFAGSLYLIGDVIGHFSAAVDFPKTECQPDADSPAKAENLNEVGK
jgi:dihydrofolate synthase/folylpolyglutamate synthase